MNFVQSDPAGFRWRVRRTAMLAVSLSLCIAGLLVVICLFSMDNAKLPSKMEDEFACLSVATRGNLTSLDISSRQKLSYSLEPWENVCSSFVVDQYDQPATRIALRRTTYVELMKMTKECRNRLYEGSTDDIGEILGFLTRNRCPAYASATGLDPKYSSYSNLLLGSASQRTIISDNIVQNGKPVLKMIYVGRDEDQIVCLMIDSLDMNTAQKKSAANSCFIVSKVL
jgi:hypothetical protein